MTGCRSNAKCNNNNRPDRLFRERRLNSVLSKEQSSRPVSGKSSGRGIGYKTNSLTHHFNQDATCSPVQSKGSTKKF